MTVTGGMSLLVLKKGSKFFLRWIKLLRYDCELAADFVLPWDEIWSNFLNASSVKHKKGCKRLVWCWHVCYARLLVACIVQAGPQFDANGEVPEKCSHFSQPLVFLRSSRRRILCNDFFLESNSIYRFVKKGESFQDLERFNAVLKRQIKEGLLEICGGVTYQEDLTMSSAPESHGHARLTNLWTQRIQLSKHPSIHLEILWKPMVSVCLHCPCSWGRPGLKNRLIYWGFTTSTYYVSCQSKAIDIKGTNSTRIAAASTKWREYVRIS